MWHKGTRPCKSIWIPSGRQDGLVLTINSRRIIFLYDLYFCRYGSFIPGLVTFIDVSEFFFSFTKRSKVFYACLGVSDDLFVLDILCERAMGLSLLKRHNE